MSESTTEINIQETKDSLLNPKTISKNIDQSGRETVAAKVHQSWQLRDDIQSTESKLDERQNNLLVKIRSKLHMPDREVVELQAQLLEQKTHQSQLPNPREMIDDFYKKTSEKPLSNQEKRDLLRPEVLKELTIDEYVALWKRLNPYFLSHVTRQGFRDHNAMVYHSGGLEEYHGGFIEVIKDEKQIRPPFAIEGLKGRDPTSVEIFLSNYVLQADTEDEAKERFDALLHKSLAVAPKYPDKTAVHFAAQLVADSYYGGETGNECFFVFPTDVLASQSSFAFNGREKDFTHPQSETKWNDVFIWPNTLENPGVPIDAGMVFLPEHMQVDPKTGSKYASEIKIVDGKERMVMIDDIILSQNLWSGRIVLVRNLR